MVKERPFGLFVLVKLRNKTIDGILKEGPYGTVFWLATHDYEDIPKKRPGQVHEGTKALPKGFISPWIGASLDDLVKWIKSMPEDAELNSHHFAVLDKRARNDPPSVVLCRIGGIDFEGKKVYVIRQDGLRAVEHLLGAPSDAWIEMTDDGDKNAQIEYDKQDDV